MKEIGRPAEVFAPGEIPREQLAERGWTPADAARRLAMETREMAVLLDGRRRVDTELAAGLAKLLGTSMELWLRLDGARFEAAQTPER